MDLVPFDTESPLRFVARELELFPLLPVTLPQGEAVRLARVTQQHVGGGGKCRYGSLYAPYESPHFDGEPRI